MHGPRDLGYFCAGAGDAGAAGAGAAAGAGCASLAFGVAAGAGAAEPGAGAAGAVFAAAAAFAMLAVTEPRTPTNDRPSDVRKNSPAHTAVSLLRKVTAPRPPNADVAAPPPSAAPIPASFPGWRRITKIMKMQSRTWTMVKKTTMRGRGP